MPVRLPPEWMQATDDRLLEFLDSEGPSSVKTIDESDKISRHYETIARRLRLLSKAGFVDKIGQGTYQINNDGRRYLEGETDFRDVEPPEAD